MNWNFCGAHIVSGWKEERRGTFYCNFDDLPVLFRDGLFLSYLITPRRPHKLSGAPGLSSVYCRIITASIDCDTDHQSGRKEWLKVDESNFCSTFLLWRPRYIFLRFSFLGNSKQELEKYAWKDMTSIRYYIVRIGVAFPRMQSNGLLLTDRHETNN